ncbi:MAG: class II aldolase/adducin family protein [Bacteroidales bacterium]|jgi:ribulose-5-phosphate 4-epimerase/fuculose-1-phosphate aldolase|nr:class II aldolase/adducin family protein [Bacteroidales bacterium]
MITEQQFQTFIEQAHRVGKESLQLCSSGNISWRVDENIALVSGTGSWLGNLKKEQIAVCEISTKNHIDGAKPSMESTFHLGVLCERNDVNVVLHVQSEYATIISCMKDKPMDFNVTAEIPCCCGKDIPVVPYFRPGSLELANAVVDAMKNHDCILLSQHGQVVCGKNFDDAFQKAVFFEMACQIIVGAGKGNYLTLSEEEIKDLEVYVLGKKQ